MNVMYNGNNVRGGVSCQHGMAPPRVTDAGDALQILRVAWNILNKQSRTADKGWSSSLGLRVGLRNLHLKIKLFTKYHKGPRTWTDSLGMGDEEECRILVAIQMEKDH
jgi:hypothetical protein